jgi:chitodextrinase
MGDSYAVDAFDAAGNVSAQSEPAAVADVTPPSVPGGVTATLSADGESVDVSWSASADNVGVTGYDVYRDGTEIATVGGTATSYADSGVADPMGDSYSVDAFDAAGNVSAQSEPAAVADVTPPTVPTGLTLQSATVTSISFRWSPSTDNVGVAGYYIYRDGSMVGTSATSSYTDTSLNNGTAYTYEVSAYDAAGNVSGTSAPASFSTLPGDSAPTTPASVKAAATVPYRVKLSWSASTDAGGSGLAGYRIYRSDAPGTILATVGPSVTSYADTRVKAKTAYTYTVVAFDAADDQSGAGKSNSVTTPVGKTTKAPTAPSKLRVSATTATSVTFTWAASTDADGIAGYHVYRDGAYIGDTAGPGTTRFADTGLTGSTTYTYTVVAFDDSANVSAGSPALKVTTKAP